ncbi:hypothetical protein KCU61_g475, partial [Aureobasidium melanogenum]
MAAANEIGAIATDKCTLTNQFTRHYVFSWNFSTWKMNGYRDAIVLELVRRELLDQRSLLGPLYGVLGWTRRTIVVTFLEVLAAEAKAAVAYHVRRDSLELQNIQGQEAEAQQSCKLDSVVQTDLLSSSNGSLPASESSIHRVNVAFDSVSNPLTTKADAEPQRYPPEAWHLDDDVMDALSLGPSKAMRWRCVIIASGTTMSHLRNGERPDAPCFRRPHESFESICAYGNDLYISLALEEWMSGLTKRMLFKPIGHNHSI